MFNFYFQAYAKHLWLVMDIQFLHYITFLLELVVYVAIILYGLSKFNRTNCRFILL